ncbi:MAG: protein-export chaperone SecB [Treponema sp.]|nr:protein-export chaperone SecB [Treponema sp.]
MAESGITAEFEFVSFKIDSISMKMGNEISSLINTNPIKQDCIKLAIKLRNTEKFIINDKVTLIGGLMTIIKITNDVNGSIILDGQFGISGIFVSKNTVDKSDEEKFAKFNLPALLMPYLRATMTNILSNAGFGTILFPLVNIYEAAKSQNLSLIDHSIES